MRHARSAGSTHGECNSEIGDERLIFVKKNIFGFDVAMYDAVLMRGLECAQNFTRDSYCVVDCELRFAIEAIAQ